MQWKQDKGSLAIQKGMLPFPGHELPFVVHSTPFLSCPPLSSTHFSPSLCPSSPPFPLPSLHRCGQVWVLSSAVPASRAPTWGLHCQLPINHPADMVSLCLFKCTSSSQNKKARRGLPPSFPSSLSFSLFCCARSPSLTHAISCTDRTLDPPLIFCTHRRVCAP